MIKGIKFLTRRITLLITKMNVVLKTRRTLHREGRSVKYRREVTFEV